MRNSFFEEFEGSFNGTEDFEEMFNNTEQCSDDVRKMIIDAIATVGIATMGFLVIAAFKKLPPMVADIIGNLR
ncbi:MAG TPA: hypothetical protein DEP65_07495 [Ruminococcus sp.]|nr:hypothetical protein [Ruminococcus sp.]